MFPVFTWRAPLAIAPPSSSPLSSAPPSSASTSLAAALTRRGAWIVLLLGCFAAKFGVPPAAAANFSEVEQQFLRGEIEEAAEAAQAEVERGVWNRRWSQLLIRCQLATGHYAAALETYDAAIERYPTSLPLRVLGIGVARFNGQPGRAAREQATIERYLQTGQLRYATAETLVAAGRFFSQNGIDARIILKSFYDRVLENDPGNLDALLATAELAVSKGDFKVAADTIATAKKRELDDARLDYLLARALQSSDPERASAALQRCLATRPTYEPALVLKAEREIDREAYGAAEKTIERILETNSESPPAYALKAVLAHLGGEYENEKKYRQRALKHWSTNPDVDHLIGRKLSDKYRFAEGAHHQRLALTFDPEHTPAKFQLAQDLLRLGEDEEGWKLAEEVNENDPYNVVAYNLMTLKDRLESFETTRVQTVARAAVAAAEVSESQTQPPKTETTQPDAGSPNDAGSPSDGGSPSGERDAAGKGLLENEAAENGAAEDEPAAAAGEDAGAEGSGGTVDSETVAAVDAEGDSGARGGGGEILIRMDPRERQIYGAAVAELLAEAKRVLCEKYALELDQPVVVEIFPKQSDFAIRTFGVPGGEGYLGVCFGPLVTANSPASQGARPSNWESVLWHEFCHVVTLTKTNNRMPRWLSEGISVYEERQRDPRWGQSMTARYRAMILGGELTPVSQLSAAFLSPPSPEHLQFAYYESSLVVEYVIETFGGEALRELLTALGRGVPINEALASTVAPMERLERGFAEFAGSAALQFGSELDFQRPELPPQTPPAAQLAWAESHPENYWARLMLAKHRMGQDDFSGALAHLSFLGERGAVTGEAGGVLEMMAACYRQLDQPARERDVLEQLFSVSPDALPALQRFIEMETAQSNWESVLNTARQAIAIQPLSASLHESIVQAARQLGHPEQALPSLRALRAMDPVDVAGLEFYLAEALAAAGERQQARKHVIDALLHAPRYRDAHHLLTRLVEEQREAKRPETASKQQSGQAAEENPAKPGGKSDDSGKEGKMSPQAVSEMPTTDSSSAPQRRANRETRPPGPSAAGNSPSRDASPSIPEEKHSPGDNAAEKRHSGDRSATPGGRPPREAEQSGGRGGAANQRENAPPAPAESDLSDAEASTWQPAAIAFAHARAEASP